MVRGSGAAGHTEKGRDFPQAVGDHLGDNGPAFFQSQARGLAGRTH